MNNRPKRRKFKDNPYELEIENNAYLIKFVDGNRKLQIIEVSPEVFKVFDDSELSDLSQMNEYDNHIEHAEICENTLYKRSVIQDKLLEDIVEESIIFEELKEAINKLSEVQKRRIKLYYFENKTLEEIAKMEHTSHQAISKNIKLALKELKKYLNF